MSYKVVTPVATEPISLAHAKNHLRVEIGETADDALITALITAARESAEHYACRAFAEQTLEAAYDGFPAENCLELPFGPAASVTSVKYDDADGVERTMATGYALSTYGTADRIDLAADADWPSTENAAESVRVRYVTKAECPKAAYAAILLIISSLYENRGELEDIPGAAKALLDTVKCYG